MKFRGHSLRNLDPKGRLLLPQEYRDRILSESGQGLVVLTILDECVVGFTAPQWAEVEAEMDKIKNPSKKLRNFRRKFLSGAEEAQIDAQGRIKLPQHLREYGGLDHDVVVAGVGQYFEIWNKAEFDRMLDGQDLDDVSEELSAAGVELPF
jgi:MraZ protein